MASSVVEANDRVNRTAQIGLDVVNIETLTEAAAKVGAPTTATVSTAGMFQKDDSAGEYYNSSVVFSWVEEV